MPWLDLDRKRVSDEFEIELMYENLIRRDIIRMVDNGASYSGHKRKRREDRVVNRLDRKA